jgi:hypothetical protein
LGENQERAAAVAAFYSRDSRLQMILEGSGAGAGPHGQKRSPANHDAGRGSVGFAASIMGLSVGGRKEKEGGNDGVGERRWDSRLPIVLARLAGGVNENSVRNGQHRRFGLNTEGNGDAAPTEMVSVCSRVGHPRIRLLELSAGPE